VNANQVFNWLKDTRLAAGDEADDTACFLPVEIVGPVRHEDERSVVGDGKMEVELAGGHRLRISGSYDPEALARLIRGLSR